MSASRAARRIARRSWLRAFSNTSIWACAGTREGYPLGRSPGPFARVVRLMPLVVRPARSFRDVGTFIDLPNRLHAGTPYVPQLTPERRIFLSRRPRLGTYARRVDFELFLAEREGRVVGRVSAQI